jgi:hypothetical protein
MVSRFISRVTITVGGRSVEVEALFDVPLGVLWM